MSAKTTNSKATLFAQLIAGVILLMAGVMKFKGDPGPVEVFTRLDMEPTGRYLIGMIEMLAGLLLLSPFAAVGALLGVSVMAGAIIAHATYLGLEVNDDGGRLVGMLVVVFLSSCFVLVKRRKELPIVGTSLE